jgi:cysteine synthase
MVKNSKEKEFVFGASNKVGWGAISLSAVCARYGKKAVFFMAHRKEPTEHQQAVIDLGGKIEWVQSGMLNVTQARAREYAQEKPNERRLLPIGLEDDTVIASIIKVARALPIKTKEIWTVASSGTLSRGLQLAFPDAKVFAVQTGHSLSKEQQGRATLIKSPYAYDKPVKPEDAPPYPSEPYYDAKLWQVVVKKASKGALIWNVAKQVAL